MGKKLYEIYEFRFVDKASKEIISIYALDQDNAEIILDIINTCNDKSYERKRFGFKRKVLVNIEPKAYVLQQKDTAEQELYFRKKKINKNQ